MANIKLHFNKAKKKESDKDEYQCKYCPHVLAGSASTTRLRAHLIGATNAGSKICPNVPDDVKKSLSCELNKRQKTAPGYILSPPSNLPPEETEGVTEAVMPPNESSSNPHQIKSGVNNHSIPWTFSPEVNNDFGNQGGVQFSPHEESQTSDLLYRLLLENEPLMNDVDQHEVRDEQWVQEVLSEERVDMTEETRLPNQLGYDETDEVLPPNESGRVESLLLPNATNFQDGETSEGVIGWTTQPVERGSTHQPDPLTTTDLMLPNESATRATIPPNETCRNLQSEAFPPTDLVTQDLRNCCLTDEAHQHGVGDAEMVQQEFQTVEANHEGEGSAFRTKGLVGEAFVKNEGKIWSWLMDDQVLRVGIYGMGGVGKTTLMRKIQTRLEGQSSLKVYWVTVSKDFSIWKLQNLIAKKIGFNFSEKEDEVERAEELTQSLKEKGKCVLILDDLWNCFNIDEVGIPVEVNACKLVLTTRLWDVCRQMDFREVNRIQLKPLYEEEAWILFTQELGDHIPEVEELAKAISKECGGLPLGIKVMARTMKEIHNVHIWRNALEELKQVKRLEMQEEVFSVLKFSFLRLKGPALQECLSYCALLPEDEVIERDKLIWYMIVEGIIDERNRQAELDKGHTMIVTLENACLLEGDTEYVFMHDLIRDMVIIELRERSNTLVKAWFQLKELPDVEKWTEDLVRVSLIGNELEVIPHSYTPRCPNLSTLLLCRNDRLKKIADSFFEQFQKLKVLDLSHCREIKVLPRSISNLVNLTALLLSYCSSLIYVPSLVKLQKLKMLDLWGCGSLQEMPEGVKFLPKLNYLGLSLDGMEERESEISKSVGWEVGELRMLETLNCRFRDPKEFGEYIESQKRSQQSLSHYKFYIGGTGAFDREALKSVYIRGICFIDPLRLPTDIEALRICHCDCTFYKGLLPPSLLSCLINLQEISLLECDGIEEIFVVMEDNINTVLVQFLFSNHSTHSLSNHSLLNLKVINIVDCHKLKKLFPPSLLPNLHNLQEIVVWDCHGMEEIFSTDEEDGQELSFGQSINNYHYPPNPASASTSTSTVSIGLNLPKLTRLDLFLLPELRSIYKGAINCHSLQRIRLFRCPKMERITLPLPQPSLWIRVGPKEWWESVQWGSANDKIHLQSLSGFEYR